MCNVLRSLFSDFPEEVIVRILHFCNYKAILRFASTCKKSLELVEKTTSLQIHVELEANGLEIIKGSSKGDATYPVILDELRRYRDAWLDFDLCPAMERSMGKQRMKLWELREGAFVNAFAQLGSQSLSDTLQVLPLDSPNLPSPVHFKTTFHDFTLDLSQELAVPVSVDTSRPTCARVHLCSSETGLAHALALHPMLFVELDFNISHSQPSGILLDVMGELLLVKFANLKSQFYEILIWNWQLGVLLNRISSRAGVCDFAFLSREHLVLYSAIAHNDSALRSVSLLVYTNIASPCFKSDTYLNTSAHFDVSSCPTLDPTTTFHFPKLYPSMSVVQDRFSLRSDPTPGYAIHTGSASFACSNVGTLGLTLSLVYNMNVTPHFVSYRIFVSANQLLDHLERCKYQGVTTLSWDEWGEYATRWFVESDDSHRNDWISWMSAGRYIRGMSDGESGSVNLSLVDFHTPRVKRHSSRAADSYIDIPRARVESIRGRATTFESRWISAQRSLRARSSEILTSKSENQVVVDVVGSHVPTIVGLGLEELVQSRLPYRTVTRVRPVPVGKAWLIDGSHIIGSDFQSRFGSRPQMMTVYKLRTSPEA